jgi:hypothetical protein
MAKTSRPKAPSFTTPHMVFKFPKLSEPDYGTKDYPKPDGEYSTKCVGKADDPAVQAFIAKLQPFHDAAVKQAQKEFDALKPAQRNKLGKITVNPLFTPVYDDDENETGEIEFKFAMKHSGEYKTGPKAGKRWSRTPDIFDAKGNKMQPVPQIWGGTVGRVAFELGMSREGQPGYFIPATGAAGVSLRLQAVRIIDLVSGGQRDAKAYGFDEEEEGYEYSPADAKTEETTATGEQTATAGGETVGDDNPDF